MYDPEVASSNPVWVIPKTLKMTPTAFIRHSTLKERSRGVKMGSYQPPAVALTAFSGPVAGRTLLTFEPKLGRNG